MPTRPTPLPSTHDVAPPAGGPCRVLLVDGHPDARLELAQLVRGEPGITLCGAVGTLAEAVDAARAEPPSLVIADDLFEDGDAFELLQRLGKCAPNARVLVLSARHESLSAERLLRAGAQGYVMKSAPTSEILLAIRRVAAGDMHVSPELGRAFQLRFVRPDPTQRSTPVCALEVLSTREFQVFQLIGHGLGTAEIAAALGVSRKTIESHRQHVRDKLALTSAPQFSRCAFECVANCRLDHGADATCELDPRRRPLPGSAGPSPNA